MIDPALYAGVELGAAQISVCFEYSQLFQLALKGDSFFSFQQSVIEIQDKSQKWNPFIHRARLAFVLMQGYSVIAKFMDDLCAPFIQFAFIVGE